MKSSDFYYCLQQMNNGRKFLPGGERATLTPEYIVWTGMLYNHSLKTQEKLKEFNLFHDTPNDSWERSIKLRQIETLDELSFAAYQASRKNKDNPKRSEKRGRNNNRKDDNKSTGNSKRSKLKCNHCKNSDIPRKNAGSKIPNSVRKEHRSQKRNGIDQRHDDV